MIGVVPAFVLSGSVQFGMTPAVIDVVYGLYLLRFSVDMGNLQLMALSYAMRGVFKLVSLSEEDILIEDMLSPTLFSFTLLRWLRA